MNKDEKIAADLRLFLTPNIAQAMQEQAIAFAEWIVNEDFRWSNNAECWVNEQGTRIFDTTADLYTLFNTNN